MHEGIAEKVDGAGSVDSEEYSCGVAEDSDEEMGYEDYGIPPESSTETFMRVKSYKCFLPSEVLKRVEEVAKEASELMNVPQDYAELFLREYGWKADSMVQDWVDSPRRMCGKLNVRYPPPEADAPPTTDNQEIGQNPEEENFFCPILACDYPMDETFALDCGHRYSKDAWRQYLITQLEDAQLALSTRCPEHKCGLVVGFDVWTAFLSAEDLERYNHMRWDAFVDRNICARWCPALKCGRVLEQVRSGVSEEDPACDCGYRFCFSCGEESHQPVECEIVTRWNKKNQSEAESMTWIIVNTKNCPVCKRPIEKGMGCMHMTCRCGAEFCWICLGDWKKHVGVNSYYRCNLFEDKDKQDPKEAERLRAKESLERYAHYFERYRAHHHGQTVAQNKQLLHIKDCMDKLHLKIGQLSEVEFLQAAVWQIIECRRMLKFSYAFGYFAEWENRPHAQHLFEYHQGQLEQHLDYLQEITEKFNPDTYIGPNCDSFKPFFDFKEHLINRTRVVRDFFEKMSRAFQGEFFNNLA